MAKTRADVTSIYKTVLGELSTRRIRDWKLLTAAGYRRNFGALPSGLDAKGRELFFVVKLKGDVLTMVVEQKSGKYLVTGLYR